MINCERVTETAKVLMDMDTIDDIAVFREKIDLFFEKIDLFKPVFVYHSMVRDSEIKKICELIKGEIPAAKLLLTRLGKGDYFNIKNGRWELYEADGEIVVHGESLKQILSALIWKDYWGRL